jgi:hypothetical protein
MSSELGEGTPDDPDQIFFLDGLRDETMFSLAGMPPPEFYNINPWAKAGAQTPTNWRGGHASLHDLGSREGLEFPQASVKKRRIVPKK